MLARRPTWRPCSVLTMASIGRARMQVIKQIGVVSLAKIMGVSGLLLGFVVGIPMGLFILLVGAVGGAAASGEGAEIAGGALASGVFGALFMMIVMPLVAGVMYFIFGLIYGLVLNLVF